MESMGALALLKPTLGGVLESQGCFIFSLPLEDQEKMAYLNSHESMPIVGLRSLLENRSVAVRVKDWYVPCHSALVWIAGTSYPKAWIMEQLQWKGLKFVKHF